MEELRRRRPQERIREIPGEVLDDNPERELELDSKRFAECLRSAPSGSASGLGGCSNEILRVCLDDRDTLLFFTKAAEDFARATVPADVFRAFMTATMTALEKRDGGVRGIATGSVFRRLVAKTLARQFGKEVEATIFLGPSCTRELGFSCTHERPERGIVQDCALTGCSSSDQVWSPCGIKILGTPVGSPEFVARLAQERLDDEEKLWNAIPWVPDLQCAWQILVQCAGPRCHHFLRTMPLSQSVEYAQGHDDGMMSTMHALLGGLTGSEEQHDRVVAVEIGWSRVEVVRMSTGAYWSSWADAMHIVAVRLPRSHARS